MVRYKYYEQKQTANADCKQFVEAVEHFISTCPVLANEHNIKRHDSVCVCAALHCNLCKEMGVASDNSHWYDQVPKLVEIGHEGKVTILWNQQCELTELLLTTNRTSQSVTINKQHAC